MESKSRQEIGFECVRPIESHARLIMEWRNDPETLKASFHSTPKQWNSFWKEFVDSYFIMPDLPPLFALYEGKRIAFIRFRNAPPHPKLGYKRCEISINLDPACRGQGLGTEILKDIQSWVAQQGYHQIYAEIKDENTPSHKAFLAAGFRKQGKLNKQVEGELVPITCYVAQLKEMDLREERVFIIAEAGSNWRMGSHARDIEMAKTLIRLAADAGADAVKFQVFRPETVYAKNAGKSSYLAEAGIEQDIHDIFTDLSMPYEMIPLLASYCQEWGVEFMATPFSVNDFEMIDSHVKRHKIASYEISHLRLIEKIARSKKATYLSTGASTEEDIVWAVETFKQNGGEHLTLLQCTAKYPCPLEDLNLGAIPWLKNRFHVPAGLSDHSVHPLYGPIIAVALGASVIEKHFTLDKRLPGPDHAFAVTVEELKEMVVAIREVKKIIGSGFKGILPSEEELRAFAHRGLQATEVIREGDILKEGYNMDILRPGIQVQGIHSKYLKEIENKKAKRTIQPGEGIQRGDWT